jgi:predicted nucleotidyltransferase
MRPGEHARAFFGLLEDLEQLFNRKIDLLEPQPIRNPYLKKEIEKSRAIIYETAA